MEAIQPETPPPLFSLTGDVSDLLLTYVAAGEGGLQSILNLRRVCSTTKKWIDDLRPAQAERILSKAQARVVLSKRTLEEFLENPPPKGVTSLKILNSEYLQSYRCTYKDNRLWMEFGGFWKPYLKFLSVDFSYFPPSNMNAIQLLLTPQAAVSLHCNLLQETVPNNPWNESTCCIPDSFSTVKNLSVDCFEIEPDLALFRQLSKIPRLKSFRFKLRAQVGLSFEGVQFLIDAHKDNVEFQLTMKLESWQEEEYQEEFRVRFWNILPSVAASASSIKIIGLKTTQLLPPEVFLGDENIANDFYRRVEWIKDFEPLEDFGLNKLSLFPNLRRLDSLRITLADPDDVLQQFTSFPPNLRRLGIAVGFPSPRSLPKGLTNLALLDLTSNFFDWSFVEVSDAIAVIDESCLVLNKLKIGWNLIAFYANTGGNRNGPLRDLSSLFKNLRSFTVKLNLSVKLTFESHCVQEMDFGLYFRFVLLKIFHVDRLRLYKLKFSDSSWYTSRELKIDSETLSSLIEGPIANSLLSLRITESSVAPFALPLLQKLQSITAANRSKRFQTHGRTCRKHHFYD